MEVWVFAVIGISVMAVIIIIFSVIRCCSIGAMGAQQPIGAGPYAQNGQVNNAPQAPVNPGNAGFTGASAYQNTSVSSSAYQNTSVEMQPQPVAVGTPPGTTTGVPVMYNQHQIV